MPQSVTTQELKSLRDAIIISNSQDAVQQAYSYLYSEGDNYASWALGVATAGRTSNNSSTLAGWDSGQL